MRYHHKSGCITSFITASIYSCNHPIYRKCTLYRVGEKGLAVIQQRYDPKTKFTWWADIDQWLVDEIFFHPKFNDFFEKNGGKEKDGLYPTVAVRQIMWRLRMKPLPKETWETVFDRKEI